MYVYLCNDLQELPGDPLNYSLYLPSSGSGKLGKYMDDGLLLSNYALQGNIPKLEVGSPVHHYSIIMMLLLYTCSEECDL